jgi:AraC-like DNA-binding protein
MVYNVYSPPAILADHVKCYWSLQAGASAIAETERVFPDGCIELIFHCGGLFKRYMATDNPQLQPRSFIHGQLKQYMDIEATGVIDIFAVRFNPGGLQPFLAHNINTVTGLSVSLHDIWQQDGKELEDKMMNAFAGEERVKIIESFLIGKLKAAATAGNIINHSVSIILQQGGSMDIDKLAAHLNISRRQLERRFIGQVGITPKLFSRIVRFNKTLSLLNNAGNELLTSHAYKGGFADQSHFIKDFKEFTGMAPKQYFKDRPGLVQLFTSH